MELQNNVLTLYQTKRKTMARLNDTSGIPNTCPKINEVISFLDNLEITEHDEGFSIEDIKNLCQIMEEIRTANDGLRTHGHNLQNALDDYEKLTKELEVKISDLESDIEHYEKQIEELEN